MAGKRKILFSVEDVRYAFERSLSFSEAARRLNVSNKKAINLAKEYHKSEGITWYDYFKTIKPVPRTTVKVYDKRAKTIEKDIDYILKGWKKCEYTKRQFLTYAYRFGFLAEECSMCGCKERNFTTQRIPLVGVQLDGDITNFKRENLEILCFNHYYIKYGKLPSMLIDKLTIEKEKAKVEKIKEENIEIDNDVLENMKRMGML